MMSAGVNSTLVSILDTPQQQQPQDLQLLPPSTDKRKFFPRIKHLLSQEYEPFLSAILESLEEHGAAHAAVASHKPISPWYKTFHSVYGGIAADCSQPVGKNRYHKFKDKIVELWNAMEQEAHHPFHAIALAQLQTFQGAVQARQNTGAVPSPTTAMMKNDLVDASSPSAVAPVLMHNLNTPDINTRHYLNDPTALPEPFKAMPAMQHGNNSVAGTANANGGTKRSANAMQYNTSPGRHNPNKRPAIFKNLFHNTGEDGLSGFMEEVKALEQLPPQLQQLLQLRLFRAHVGAVATHQQDATPQSHEDETLEYAYQQCLQEFLGPLEVTSPETNLWAILQTLMLLWQCSQQLLAASIGDNGADGNNAIRSFDTSMLANESKTIWATYQDVLRQYLHNVPQAKGYQQVARGQAQI